MTMMMTMEGGGGVDWGGVDCSAPAAAAVGYLIIKPHHQDLDCLPIAMETCAHITMFHLLNVLHESSRWKAMI